MAEASKGLRNSKIAKYESQFKGKKVLITGGLGFIGSNLAIRLVEQGADVLLVDSLIPDYGGNLFNIEPIKDKVRVNIADVRDVELLQQLSTALPPLALDAVSWPCSRPAPRPESRPADPAHLLPRSLDPFPDRDQPAQPPQPIPGPS